MKTKLTNSAITFLFFFAPLLWKGDGCEAFSQSYQWAVGGGGTNGDWGNAITVDAAGNSYVTGWFQSTAFFGTNQITSAGHYDIFIAKYNTNGQLVWLKQAGGIDTDIAYGIDLDNYGNLYLGGTFQATATFGSITVSSSNASPDIFIARYDTSGNCLWVQSAGSTTDDQAQAIAVDKASSKIYLSGYFRNTATFGSLSITSSGNSDVFIAKYDSIAALNGTPLWLQKGGGSAYDNCYSVCTDAGGNAYITGYIAGTATFGSFNITSAGDDDIMVVKYNSAGAVQWAHRDGGAGLDRGLKITAHGNSVAYTGWFNGTAMFGALPLTSAGVDEIFVAAIDTNGNVQWVNKAGGTGYDQGYGICTDASGNVFATGAFDGTALFNTTPVTSAGSWDIFIAKYSPAGIFQWVLTAGSPALNPFDRDIGYGIAADTLQNLYAAGIIRNTAAFGPFSITSAGIQDVFVTKISVLASVQEQEMTNGVLVYSNPFTESATIVISPQALVRNPHLLLFDTMGKVVYYSQLKTRSTKLYRDNLAAGIYFYRVSDNGKVIGRGKIVIE